MRSIHVFGWGIVGVLATLGATAGDAAYGQALKLDERLHPPRTFVAPPTPSATSPAPRAPSAADTLRRAAAPLPVAEIPRTSSAAPLEARRQAFRHPALDVSEVASAARPSTPAETRLPTTAGAFMRGPNPDQPLAEVRTPRETELAPSVSADPKALAAFRFLTSPVAPATPAPAPLLRLTIPDPWGALQASRIPGPDLDRDPPVVRLGK